ncbi:hypothetical protein HQ45_08490 [Porphyromonas crevioricanis]|uniref:Uncharacterized protein n=1 Tax=Porphyromonas crevioricanis TaxID=393921 RepID=A0A0A2G0B9_9PORP|nr:hypothetical protein [Porphyromonas crevioricanis]KGN88726.1 hypothetical protein HQ45_08490 [Porphyromonas crevioricanis]KGN93904.1 hypothetical protein HQ38_07775 [Porphyromonas crevioricanis]SQH73658.1 Uncharacterised protein [Porphyromonas crevioricanis]
MMRKTLLSWCLSGLLLCVLHISCHRHSNCLHLSIDQLTDSLVVLRWHGNSTTHTDSLYAKDGKLDWETKPDTSIFRSLVVSYNHGRQFRLYNFYPQTSWQEQTITNEAGINHDVLEIDSLDLSVRTLGGQYIKTDSLALEILVSLPDQVFDSIQLKRLQEKQALLKKPDYFLSCILTPSDSIAKASVKKWALDKGSVCSDIKDQTMRIIQRFEIRHLPALVSIDTTNKARRIYL